MSRIEAVATVTEDGKLTLHVPPEVGLAPGQHRVVVEIDERGEQEGDLRNPVELPVLHVGAWPDGMSLRREDLYGEHGR